jgi:TetR/AcrR family transcriptional repressor of nem operon
MPRVETFDRDQVLQNAMQVFWKNGYNATSMQQLVNATGLNRSSLYNSFGDKMDLYRASLKAYTSNTQEQLQQATSKAKNPLQAIRSVFENFLPEIVNENKGCMGMSCKSEMSADVGIKSFLENNQEQTLLMFERLVTSGQETGNINKNQTARDYAWHIYNSFQGYRMTGVLVKDEQVLRTIIDNSLKILE